MHNKNIFIHHGSFQDVVGHISKLSFETGETEWSYPCEEKLMKFLAIVDHVLILRFERISVGLNIHTGKEVWRNSAVQFFNKEKKRLEVLSGKWYMIIDPLTGKIIEEHINEEWSNRKKYGFDRRFPAYFDDYIVSTSSDQKRIGIFNTQSLQWEWTYDMGVGILGHEKFLKVDENRIYVVDHKKNLWIFEREDEI